MKQEVQDKLKQIRGRFRLMMNGVASQSMREKGLGYKINWGIDIPTLKRIATEYGKDYDLAVELWKDDIRECKILATMIMPPSEMKADLVGLWIDQMPNQEMAELAAFNLFQHIPDAKDFALKWLSVDNELTQLCGYQVLSRLFMKGHELNEREINEFFDQAQTALEGGGVAVRHAAANALSRFGMQGSDYEKILKSAFRNLDLDIF